MVASTRIAENLVQPVGKDVQLGDDEHPFKNARIGGDGKGGFAEIKAITEEVEIAVGLGSGGVATSGNLWPAGIILGTAFVVTQAPGGGATTLDIGPTGGTADSLIDAKSCDVLEENGKFPDDGDGATYVAAPVNNSATTLTLTTDSDVTTSAMKVRVTTFYIELSPPTE